MTERWLAVVGYEGLYEVSDFGRLSRDGRILKLQGYGLAKHYGAQLCKDGVRRNQYIHVLVLEAFVGSRPTCDHQGCHRDGCPNNNRLDNLYWGTAKQNSADRLRHGTNIAGEDHFQAKLSTEDLILLRSIANEGVPQKDLAVRFGVSVSTISRAISRKSYRGPDAWGNT